MFKIILIIAILFSVSALIGGILILIDSRWGLPSFRKENDYRQRKY